jgi:hypothetical protein
MTAQRRPEAGVQVTTRTPPIAFLFLLFKTNVTINGDRHVVKWGTNHYPLDPGHHTVEIGFRYFFGRNMGRATTEFDVVAGQLVRLTYLPPAQIFSSGSILID